MIHFLKLDALEEGTIKIDFPSDITWENLSKEEQERIESEIDDTTIEGDLEGCIFISESKSPIGWEVIFEEDE